MTIRVTSLSTKKLSDQQKKKLCFLHRSYLAFNVNKNPTRCNSMQIFIYCRVTLHVSGVTAPIIRITKNVAPSGHAGGKYLYQYYDLYWRLRLQFLVILMMGAVTPEMFRVTLQ